MNAGTGGPERDVVESIVERVAACRDTDPTALDPLAASIDPELLGQFAGADAVLPSSRLQFEFGGCLVTVDGSGEVGVEPLD